MSKGSILGESRPRRFVAIVASACVVAVLFCNLANSQDDVLSGDEAAVVKARVQKIRGLKLKTDVPVTYLSVAETEARFTSEFAKKISQEEIDTSVEESKMIGLFPPDLKIERKDLADMTLELAGFYDNHRKDIVIIDRPLSVELPERYRNAVTEMRKLDTMGTLGHELTHALQDQHFDIEAAQKKYKSNTDRELAYKAIVEGDATLSGFSVVTGRVDDETIDYFNSHLQDIVPIFMGRMEGKPRAMTYPFIFQYTEGARFVAEAYHRKKWAGVNALFNGPPLSTQQIMHPELYFDHPTPALTVKSGRLREGPARLEKNRRGHARRADDQDHARAHDGRGYAVHRGVDQVDRRSNRRAAKGKIADRALDAHLPQRWRRRQLRSALFGNPRQGPARHYSAQGGQTRSRGLRNDRRRRDPLPRISARGLEAKQHRWEADRVV